MSKRMVKLAALVMCGVFALGLVFSFALAIEHGGHCSHAQTCSVCLQILAVRELYRQLVLMLALFCALALSRAGMGFARGGYAWLPKFFSPVALKVRMNN